MAYRPNKRETARDIRLIGEGHADPRGSRTWGYRPVACSGNSEQAIEDALVVCALFNIIDRMADALDVAIPSAEGFAQTAERLLEQGYF